VEVDLEAEKLGKKILLRSDGTSVYMTQDLGTSVLKNEDFHPDLQIWVVGDEQIHHFNVLFATLKKLGYPWAQDPHQLKHMAYGMVDLPSGKMKGREGKVVDADDLLDEMETVARDACLERVEPGDDPPADLEERACLIGQGALKYWLLKFGYRTRILFDPAVSIHFEGDTGPYIQYACARIHSILDKGRAEPGVLDAKCGLLAEEKERDVALRVAEYPKFLKEAAEELDPSVLAGYLLALAKSVARFYNICPVLKAPSAELRTARLRLCLRVLAVLEDGLRTLTIAPLESM
jgi:arginyl-tRNA synthetase